MLPSSLPDTTDHVPVLADEVLAVLAPRPGETVVDATFGAGGHARLLAERLRGEGKLIAIDRDPTVAPYVERVRRETRTPIRFLGGDFATVLEHLAGNGKRAEIRRSFLLAGGRVRLDQRRSGSAGRGVPAGDVVSRAVGIRSDRGIRRQVRECLLLVLHLVGTETAAKRDVAGQTHHRCR